MTQNIDQVTEDVAKELGSASNEGTSGLIVTTASMVDFLLQSKIPGPRIEEMTGSDPGFVKKALNDDTPYNEDTVSKEIKRLRVLYLREGLKCLFRKYPFLGTKKAAHRLGITAKECGFIYDSLISSGELKYKLAKATWAGADAKELLREHVVID